VDIAHQLCRRLGVSVAERRGCLAAARLRDVGMIAVPPDILAKPRGAHAGRASHRPRSRAVGVELLRALPETRELSPIVGQHHERFDGAGYPLGLRGGHITLEARIITAAEAWIEVAGDRGAEWARREIERRAGGQLDPEVVGALLTLLVDGAIAGSGTAQSHAA
jgi:HD-GYP domain-containing protein (c-di-GMP phosphodiesterase class II)